MQPVIESGEGDNSDYWAAVDQKARLDYAHGDQRIYEAFYGQDAIRVTWDGSRYDIINGRHRIWLAKHAGLETLPVHLIERQ